MIETAGAHPLAALPAIAARMDALIAAGHAKEDLAVIGNDAVNGNTARHFAPPTSERSSAAT
jgi:hypothetical protein